jgi:hypothetical protein
MRYVLSRGRTEVAEPFTYTEERGRLGFGGVERGGAEYGWYVPDCTGGISVEAWENEV